MKIYQLFLNTFKRIFYSKLERRHSLVGPAGLWQMKREFQISFLKRQGLQPHHTLLDIGCGTLRGGIPIIEYLDPGNYTGIESRKKVLDEGKRELLEYGLLEKSPRLILCSDFSLLNVEQCFDYIWAYSVLIHLADDILDRCLLAVSSHLKKKSGVFYANVNLGVKPDGEWESFPVVYRPMAFYIEAAKRHELLVRAIGSTYDFGHNSGIDSQDSQIILCFYANRGG